MPPKNGLATRILSQARKGYPLVVVAAMSRVRERDLRTWIEEGDKDGADPEAQRFTLDYRENWYGFIAMQHDVVAESTLTGKDAPNCMARLALLERIAPELYARRVPEAPTPPAASPVAGQVAALSEEERAEIAEVLKRRRGSQVADVGGTNLKRL